MDEKNSTLDIHYNDFVNNRLNNLSSNVTSKNLEYQKKLKQLDENFKNLSKLLSKNEKEKLVIFKDLCYDIATFDLHKAYTLGFLDACQIRKKFE